MPQHALRIASVLGGHALSRKAADAVLSASSPAGGHGVRWANRDAQAVGPIHLAAPDQLPVLPAFVERAPVGAVPVAPHLLVHRAVAGVVDAPGAGAATREAPAVRAAVRAWRGGVNTTSVLILVTAHETPAVAPLLAEVLADAARDMDAVPAIAAFPRATRPAPAAASVGATLGVDAASGLADAPHLGAFPEALVAPAIKTTRFWALVRVAVSVAAPRDTLALDADLDERVADHAAGPTVLPVGVVGVDLQVVHHPVAVLVRAVAVLEDARVPVRVGVVAVQAVREPYTLGVALADGCGDAEGVSVLVLELGQATHGWALIGFAVTIVVFAIAPLDERGERAEAGVRLGGDVLCASYALASRREEREQDASADDEPDQKSARSPGPIPWPDPLPIPSRGSAKGLKT